MFHRGVDVRSKVIMGSVFATSLLFLSVSGSFAASFQDRNVESLSESSENVYRVKILSQAFVEHNGFPLTKVETKVLETFRGVSPNSEVVNFFLPGGKHNGASNKKRRVVLSGTPRFRTDGEYIVFLSKVPNADEMNRLEAWEAFAVSKDVRTGDRYVMRLREQREPEKASSHHHHSHKALSAEAQNLRLRSYDDVVTEIFSAN